MGRGKRQEKKKDGWFFSKSLLDEIYQIPVDNDSSTENAQENESATVTQIVKTEKSLEVTSESIAAEPDTEPEQVSVLDVDQIDNSSQIHRDTSLLKEKEEKEFFDSDQEYSYSTVEPEKTKNTEENFSLVEEEGKLVYKKIDDEN